MDRDQEPFTHWKGQPIYAATLLVIVHVAMLLVWMVVLAVHRDAVLGAFAFSTVRVLQGWVWQPLTYALVHAPVSIGQTLWFAIEMYMLFIFGRELERFFGRRVFLQMYALLWLLPPAILLCLAWMGPLGLAGSQSLHFAVFIAFATLYPNAQMLFGISAKWVAFILIAVSVIPYVASNDFISLLLLGASTGAAYLFVRYQRGEITLPSFQLPRRKPKLRVLPRPSQPAPRIKVAPPADTMDDVDALLDKIARSGMASLSAAERARLERASADLKKRP